MYSCGLWVWEVTIKRVKSPTINSNRFKESNGIMKGNNDQSRLIVQWKEECGVESLNDGSQGLNSYHDNLPAYNLNNLIIQHRNEIAVISVV